MTRLRQLGRDSLVYGFGAILAKSVGFMLLPIYTRIFTPAEYGTIEMLSVIASFVSVVLVMGMDSAQSFYFFRYKSDGKSERAKVVSAVLQWRLTWGLAIVSIATISAPLLNAMFFSGRLTWEYFAVAFAGVLFAKIMNQSVEVLRLLYRPWPYVLIIFSQTVLAAGLILVLVLSFNQGIFGYFLGTLLASASIASVGWYLVRDYLDFTKLHTDWWPKLFRFGAPLLPAGIAMYVMNTSDRWFIQYYHGETMLGLYAIGAKFALLMAIAVETFRKAWWPIAMDAMHSEDGPETYRSLARLFIGAGVAAVVLLAFLSPWLVKWLTAASYHQAWPLVGILAWQSLFFGFYSIASGGIWKREKTYYAAYLMIGAALLNLLLNFLLVPDYAEVGAALATSGSFLVWIVATLALSERLWSVGYPFGLMFAQISVGAATVAWIVTQTSFEQPFTLTSAMAVLIVLIFLLASVFLHQHWRRAG